MQARVPRIARGVCGEQLGEVGLRWLSNLLSPNTWTPHNLFISDMTRTSDLRRVFEKPKSDPNSTSSIHHLLLSFPCTIFSLSDLLPWPPFLQEADRPPPLSSREMTRTSKFLRRITSSAPFSASFPPLLCHLLVSWGTWQVFVKVVQLRSLGGYLKSWLAELGGFRRELRNLGDLIEKLVS